MIRRQQFQKKKISEEISEKYGRTRLHGGEILMAVVGSVGKLGLAPSSWKGANIARALCRIKPAHNINKSYMLILLQSELMQNSFKGDVRTLAQPTLNVGLIKNSLTPIPPFLEQYRIVAKVDELMALCDRIKNHLQHQQADPPASGRCHGCESSAINDERPRVRPVRAPQQQRREIEGAGLQPLPPFSSLTPSPLPSLFTN